MFLSFYWIWLFLFYSILFHCLAPGMPAVPLMPVIQQNFIQADFTGKSNTIFQIRTEWHQATPGNLFHSFIWSHFTNGHHNRNSQYQWTLFRKKKCINCSNTFKYIWPWMVLQCFETIATIPIMANGNDWQPTWYYVSFHAFWGHLGLSNSHNWTNFQPFKQLFSGFLGSL